MSKLSEKVSYLHGLAEGMKLGSDSNEGKLIVQMLDLLSDLISEIDDMHEEFDELNDYVETIDEDLSELESVLGDDDDEDDDDDDDEDDFDFNDFPSLLDDDDDDDDLRMALEDVQFDDEDDDDEGNGNGVLDYFTRESELDDEDDDDDNDGMYVGCACPKCGGLFCIDPHEHDEGMLYVCPHCKENIEATPVENDSFPVAKAFNEDDKDEGEDGELKPQESPEHTED